MFSKLFAAMAFGVVVVNAQGTPSSSAPAGSPSLDACTLQCVSLAAAADGCNSFTNVTCVCTNPQFQADAGGCIATNCPAADVQAALALQAAECSAAGLAPTGPSATPSVLPFSSAASSASASASGSVSASAASSAPVSVTAPPSVSASASASAPSASSGGSSPSASSSGSAAASTPSASSPANFVVANVGAAAIMAMIAGFLAI